MTYRCSKCDRDLPRDAYSPDKRNSRGLQAQCKACRADAMRAYRDENPDRTAEINHQSYLRHREKRLAEAKEYYRENRAHYLQYNRRYYQENRERLLEKGRQWARENREQVNERRRNWENQLRANGGDLTTGEWERIQELFAHRCAYCFQRTDLEQDHLIPVSDGGRHEWDNVVPACRSCNARKWKRSLLEFMLAEQTKAAA